MGNDEHEPSGPAPVHVGTAAPAERQLGRFLVRNRTDRQHKISRTEA